MVSQEAQVLHTMTLMSGPSVRSQILHQYLGSSHWQRVLRSLYPKTAEPITTVPSSVLMRSLLMHWDKAAQQSILQ